MIEEIQRWIHQVLDAPPKKVMDPACGPGTWLTPFAQQGCYVAGNDLRSAMINEAAKQLKEFPHELRVGDMRKLSFRERDFDACINLDASIGHLPDEEAILEHLQSVYQLLRPGGVYLVGMIVFDTFAEHDPALLYTEDFRHLEGGGEGRLRYTSLFRDATQRKERIQVELWTRGNKKLPGYMIETYDLLTFPAQRLKSLIEQSGFRVAQIYDIDDPELELQDIEADAGDLNLILQRPHQS